MKSALMRSFLLFSVLLSVCAAGMTFILVAGHRQIAEVDNALMRNNSTILQARNLALATEGMVGAHRGYLLSGDAAFIDEYAAQKESFSNTLAELADDTGLAPTQANRLVEIKGYFNELTALLEARATTAFEDRANGAAPRDVFKLVQVNAGKARALKDSIIRTNGNLLHEETAALETNQKEAERRKSRYFTTLMLGGAVGTILLLMFNTFLVHAQSGRSRAEESLRNTEQRLALAIEGANDGIFDWNLKDGSIFFSARFFRMLGYDRASFTGTIRDFMALLHPEEAAGVREKLERYLAGETPEYSQIFRMKHANGKWMWIQSRGKAVFDSKGYALRMVGAHSDITMMIEHQETLESQKNAAEESNRAKRDFLAHMSHEIRTPLTSISGIAEILEGNKDNLNEKQQKLVRVLGSSAGTLKDLVNDILDFAKIESRELELENKPFTPSEIFEDIISMMAMRANEKGLSFLFDYKALQNVVILGDALRLRQILVNLIGNAIKFTEKGGISIRAFVDRKEDGQDTIRVDVEDTGIGIGAESFDMIFERFKQGDASVSRKYGGTGLGLPISRNLAQLMGGDIMLNSERGKGSVFSLIIPLHQVMSEDKPQPVQAAPKLDQRLRDALGKGAKILIAEDYEGNIAVLGYLLDELSCAYDVARTGEEAVNLWKKGTYSMVLMDIQMPEKDGFTATQDIRTIEADKDLPRTPIIGMTAHALIEDKNKCIEAGMDDYLSKPIDNVLLKKKMLALLLNTRKAA